MTEITVKQSRHRKKSLQKVGCHKTVADKGKDCWQEIGLDKIITDMNFIQKVETYLNNWKPEQEVEWDRKMAKLRWAKAVTNKMS